MAEKAHRGSLRDVAAPNFLCVPRAHCDSMVVCELWDDQYMPTATVPSDWFYFFTLAE
jgi:hypothetical protein